MRLVTRLTTVLTDARDRGTRRSICWSIFEDTHRENEGFGRMEIYVDLLDSYTPIFFYVGWFIVKLLRFLGHWQAMSVGIMMAVSSTTANGYHWAATAAPFIIIIVLSPFLAPYLVSRRYGSMYLSNLLMNQSPRAFARVPVLTRVNDSKLATRSF